MSDAVTLKLIEIVRADPGLVHVLRTVRELDLPDWRLVAGAVYQAVWNAKTGRPAGYGIKDYGLAYFDGTHLFEHADPRLHIIRRRRRCVRGCVRCGCCGCCSVVAPPAGPPVSAARRGQRAAAATRPPFSCTNALSCAHT